MERGVMIFGWWARIEESKGKTKEKSGSKGKKFLKWVWTSGKICDIIIVKIKEVF